PGVQRIGASTSRSSATRTDRVRSPRPVLAHAQRMQHADHMSKMIQIRHVPACLHRELVRRAKARGLTLTQYLQEILEREVSRPAAEEVFARVHARKPVALDRPASELLGGARA